MTEANADQIHLRGASGAFQNREYVVTKGEFVVGRLPGSDLIIKEDTISGRHAKIVRGQEFYEVIDLDSTNGTFVNDERIQRKMLRTGDKIKFDIFEFEFINPTDVPRTVMADAPGDTMPEKTIISSAARDAGGEEETVRLPAPEQTVKLPAPDETVRLPVEEVTEPIREKPREQSPPPQKQQPVSAYKKDGNLFGGLILGLLLALAIGYVGAFLGAWASTNFSMNNVLQLFLVVGGVFPQFHLPTHWMGASFSFSTIIVIAGIILGLIVGGLVMRQIARKKRLMASLWFALIYMLIVFVIQFAVLQFDFRTLTSAYSSGSLGFRDPLINILLTTGSIFVIAYIFSFIGSLFSRKS